MLMRKLLVVAGVLLCSAPVLAQGEKKPKSAAVVKPTALPGEEKLSARERAERDFIMPVRRKQAATLRAAAEEAPLAQPAVEVTARNLEAVEEEKPAETTETKAAPAAPARRTTTHRRTSSSARRTTSSRKSSSHRTSSAKKKTTSKQSSTKKKTSSRRRR